MTELLSDAAETSDQGSEMEVAAGVDAYEEMSFTEFSQRARDDQHTIALALVLHGLEPPIAEVVAILAGVSDGNRAWFEAVMMSSEFVVGYF